MNRQRFGAIARTLVMALIIAAVAAPGMSVRIALAQTIGQATYNGISFSYDPALATAVQGHTAAGNVGQGGSVWDIRPEHASFSFDGYPAKGIATPQIRVIPLAEYKLAQAGSGISAELSALEKYLSGGTGGSLPLLPPVNAQRIISEQVAPLAGTGVSGVRFIASYSQGIVPVSMDNITYTFIGLTPDSKYYIEGVFPVALSSPLAPAPSPITPEKVQAYNQSVAETLRNTGASSFTPTLDTLDKMMGSIQVNPSGTPGMPRTGVGTSPYQDVIFPVLALAAILTVLGWVMHTRAKARP